MQERYLTLQVIFSIVKDDPNPAQYPVSPRDLILRLPFAWDHIQQHLNELAEEGFVEVKMLDKLHVFINEPGIGKVKGITAVERQ